MSANTTSTHAAISHQTAETQNTLEPAAFYVLVPDPDAPGEHIAVFSDGSMGPAPRDQGETAQAI